MQTLTKSFSIYANATYSSNKIQSGKQYLSSNEYLDLSGNSISGFPDFLASFGLSYNNYGFYLSLSGRYVGKFYSDNYDNKIFQYLNEHPGFISYSDNVNEAYFVSDAFISYEVNLFGSLNKSKVYFQVNNIFDTLYSANAIGPEFFPAAERNFLAGIQLGL